MLEKAALLYLNNILNSKYDNLIIFANHFFNQSINLSKQVFITGGTGFLGSYIIKELVEKGYSVIALRRSKKIPAYLPSFIFENVEWIDGDILDVVILEEAMKNANAVIHAAAHVSFNKSDRQVMYQTNIEGTANVVNAAIENNIPRFIHISSVAAVGRTINGELVTEEKKWEESSTNTHYGKTKYGGEMEAWRGMGEGLSLVVVNPSTVIGYGDWNNSSCKLFKNVYDTFPWYSNGINGFVDVEDVARAIVLLMETSISNERFIINGDNWSFRKLFNSIAAAFGKKQPWREATPFLGEVAWRIEWIKSIFSGKKPLLTKESARVAHSKTNFSNRKLLEALPGFSFTPLEISIKKACKKYQNDL